MLLPVNDRRLIAVRALLVWLLILVLAVLNGVLREELLVPLVGTYYALLLSGVLLSGLIMFCAWLTLPFLDVNSSLTCLGVGAFWLLLTPGFEFLFAYAQGRTFSVQLQAYTFSEGNLWPLVLLITFLSPLLALQWRRRT